MARTKVWTKKVTEAAASQAAEAAVAPLPFWHSPFPDRPSEKSEERDSAIKYGTLGKIKKKKRSTINRIKEALFQTVVRDIAQDIKNDLRFTQDALEGLRYAAEDFLVEVLSYAFVLTLHRKRVTLTVHDLVHACRIRREGLVKGMGQAKAMDREVLYCGVRVDARSHTTGGGVVSEEE